MQAHFAERDSWRAWHFIEAQALWVDADRIELPARPTDEPRFLIVGQIRQDLWTAR